ELAAAVCAYAARAAVVVRVEQVAQTAQPRGLYVHHPRRIWEGLDVFDRVDRRIPREVRAVRREHLLGLRRERGVLDPRLRERLHDAPVQRGVRGLIDDRPRVEALEVDRVDRTRVAQLRD